MTAPEADLTDLELLDDAQCVQLLRSHRVGRIALVHESWPLILPVNYVYDEPNVIIKTGHGALLTSTPLTTVAFEIDDVDPDGAWGWSVVVQGPAFDISDAADSYSERLRLATVEPFAPGTRDHWLKITAVHLSGRRFDRRPRPDPPSQADQGSGALHALSRHECFELLATQPLGRLALGRTDHAPLVVPVNFVLDGEDIVFRSDAGTKLHLLDQGPVAFQVDFIDWNRRSGWSVLATGLALEAEPQDFDHLRLAPWAPGDKAHWIRLHVTEVGGRHLDPVELPWSRDARAYL